MSRGPRFVGGFVGLLVAALFACGGLLVWFAGGKDRYEMYQNRSEAEAAARVRRVEYRHAGQGLAFELETGVIGPDYLLADLIVRFSPNRIDTYREFSRVIYWDGERTWIDLWVRAGRVVEAWRYREARGGRTEQDGRFTDRFFEMSAADRADRRAELDAVWTARREAAMAAAGAANYTGYHDPTR